MPLHLLGKKSWNVYNTENVDRVRRDEAAARAREEEAERRMQEADSARRIALLRGETPPALSPTADPDAGREGLTADSERKPSQAPGPRKRKRLRGEDDTDREIRYAREDVEAGQKAKDLLLRRENGHQDEPLLDHAGHLQLIPAPDEKAIRKAEKNAEAEAEKAKKRKREEDQVTMRFSNAAGFNNDMASKPWYAAAGSKASTERSLILPHVQEKDAWGNEDPRRKEREQHRISSNDPFAAMQQAQRQLKQSERDKENWQRERSAEAEELKRAEKRRRRDKKHRRRRDDDEASLNGFSLDAANPSEVKRDRHGRHHHRHRRRSRSRSPS